jgi:hypothetical protein
MLLWGPSGAGKTTWACSAPGKKLILNFDPDGFKSVAYRDDVDVLDLSDRGHKVLENFTKFPDDPFGLSKEIEKYDTLILDSVTALSQLALERGVALSAANSRGGQQSSIEFPGLQGYGARTTVSVMALRSMLRVTGRYDKNFIAITHEDDPEKDSNGNTLYISMMLGGKIKNNVALQISEIWYMQASEKDRKVLIRPARGRQPMKTRMFDQGNPEFVLKYDADKPDEGQADSLAAIYQRWVDGGKKKISLPK